MIIINNNIIINNSNSSSNSNSNSNNNNNHNDDNDNDDNDNDNSNNNNNNNNNINININNYTVLYRYGNLQQSSPWEFVHLDPTPHPPVSVPPCSITRETVAQAAKTTKELRG